MATYVTYNPTTIIGKAMFNFDVYGISNYKLDGVVRVSVSDAFSYTDWYNSDPRFYQGLYYNTTGSNEVAWTTSQTDNIKSILNVYSQFAKITFSGVADYDSTTTSTIANPADVGRLNVSDINITWLSRSDVGFSAISGGGSDDQVFDYTGGAGDVFLNRSASNFNRDFTLAPTTKGAQILMHELGHSFGLAHPHSAYSSGTPTITSDYAATQYLGFSQLGFRTNSSDDMYKEYFTIMSYDDQRSSVQDYRAYTPMILDVIALQQAYGEGSGTTGSGNDTITPGNAGYRTYFDTGGIDTIDLSMYTNGAYLNMGEVITGAGHRVGVSMGLGDSDTIKSGGNPASLRWFYGEFENAAGSPQADLIYGTDFANDIKGGAENDTIYAGGGNDTLTGDVGNDYIDGGDGIDTAVYSGARANYSITPAPNGFTIISVTEGIDALTNVEFAQFSDQTIPLTISAPVTATKAKVFLGTDGSFTVYNKGTSIYGSAGNNAVTIGSGATGVLLDQNVERINFSDASSNYIFKQTGNLINIYDASEVTLLAKAPVQGDSNGTVLSFSDGTASAKLAGGVMTLGDVALNSVTARVLSPATTTSVASSTNLTKAKVFLGAGDDNFTVSDSGTTFYGNTGNDVVMIAPWVTGVILDQNVERINLYGASNNFAFKQTGNIINIYDISGTLLLAKAPVQGDADGTLLSFDDGIAEAHVTGGVMRLGDATVSASTPTTLHLIGIASVLGLYLA
jgi:hypothetical protein